MTHRSFKFLNEKVSLTKLHRSFKPSTTNGIEWRFIQPILLKIYFGTGIDFCVQCFGKDVRIECESLPINEESSFYWYVAGSIRWLVSSHHHHQKICPIKCGVNQGLMKVLKVWRSFPIVCLERHQLSKWWWKVLGQDNLMTGEGMSKISWEQLFCRAVLIIWEKSRHSWMSITSHSEIQFLLICCWKGSMINSISFSVSSDAIYVCTISNEYP